jgi:hypothetical protein
VGSRPAIEEQCSGYAFISILDCFASLFRGAGGGEVSGGGTLYMKWGAGRNSATRVLKARADRETHTHFLFTHSLLRTQNNFIKNTLKKSLKYSEF